MASPPAPSQSRGASRTGSARSQYVPRACQECRRRRAKCDGQKPSCSRCRDRSIDCVWSTNVDHRGSAPRAYVSLLQTRIRNLEKVLQMHDIDADASLAEMGRRSDAATQPTELQPDRETLSPLSFASPTDSRASASSSNHIRQTGILEQDHDTAHDAPFFGATSGRLELRPEAAPSSTRQHYGRTNMEMSTDGKSGSCESPARGPLANSDLIEHLVDVYFEWEQPWLQVVDETLFRDSWQRNGRYFSPLLLDCMLALASRYSTRLQVRSDPSDVNTAGKAFSQSAEARLQSELKWPRITTVQSLAILATYYVAIGSDATGWLHQGMAIRLILDMGLNVDSISTAGPESSRLSQADIQLRRQIYWSLYCTDKLWASYTGRVCTMLDAQGSVPLVTFPTRSDGSPAATSGSTRHGKNALIALLRSLSTQCQILERILTQLYAPKKTLVREADQQLFLNDCLISLQEWLFTLPKELKVPPDQPDATLPHTYVLHMCYHTSIILLIKPFLPTRRHQGVGNTDQNSHEDSSDPHDDDRQQYVLQLGQQAAKAICSLGNRYRGIYGGFRRSPLTATHCTLTAALMTLYLASGQEAGRSDRAQLKSCAATLGELADAWEPARRYHRILSRILGDLYGRMNVVGDSQHKKAELKGPRTETIGLYASIVPTGSGEMLVQHYPNSPVLVDDHPPQQVQQQEINPTDTDSLLPCDDSYALAMDTLPPLDFSQVDLGQLDFYPLSTLPMDYLSYNPPNADFSWFSF